MEKVHDVKLGPNKTQVQFESTEGSVGILQFLELLDEQGNPVLDRNVEVQQFSDPEDRHLEFFIDGFHDISVIIHHTDGTVRCRWHKDYLNHTVRIKQC